MPAQQPLTPTYVLKDVAACPSLEGSKYLIGGLVYIDHKQISTEHQWKLHQPRR